MADRTSNAQTPAPPTCYRVSLIKGEHRWQFKWEPGNEATLINSVAAIARDPEIPFDWYDAAAVCRHITQPFGAAAASQVSQVDCKRIPEA